MSLTFITSNPTKAEQLGRHLDFPVQHRNLDLAEIQSLNLNEIINHKAYEGYKAIHQPVLVEDTSLVFSALGKLPGPFIKWFLKELGNEGLCKLLDQHKDRTAKADVAFGLYDGQGMRIFKGSMAGTIADVPRGNEGFGWDPIFIPEGYSKTWGEMSADEQKETSMRRIALKQLEDYLKK